MNSVDTFEAMVNEHYEALFRFALSLTRAEADAQDLTQHTFYTYAIKGNQLRDPSKAKSWLFSTLHRAFLAIRRKQTRFSHEHLDEVADELPATVSPVADLIDAPQVLRALAGVDQIFRAAVALFYLEDYSYKEIAATLKLPVGTVKSRIARGITQLRQRLLADPSFPQSGVPAPSPGYSAPEVPDQESLHRELQDRLQHENETPHPCPRPFRRREGESSSGFSVVQAAHSSVTPATAASQAAPQISGNGNNWDLSTTWIREQTVSSWLKHPSLA